MQIIVGVFLFVILENLLIGFCSKYSQRESIWYIVSLNYCIIVDLMLFENLVLVVSVIFIMESILIISQSIAQSYAVSIIMSMGLSIILYVVLNIIILMVLEYYEEKSYDEDLEITRLRF